MLESEKKQSSIVLVGEFNPAMFHPEWFSKNLIIPQEEVDFAKSQKDSLSLIVTPQFTCFKTSQFNIRIEEKRFQVVSEKEPFILLNDFIGKTFEKLGGYTIKSYGINYSSNYNLMNKSNFLKFGDKLAPKSFWSSLLEDEMSGEDRKSGLVSIQMKKVKKDDLGHISLSLHSSSFYKFGVVLNCNDHTEVSEENSNAEYVLEELNRTFDERLKKLVEIQEGLINEVTKDNND